MIEKKYSPETKLLLYCARTQVGDETAAQIKSLANGPLNWDALLDRADDHMVLPLLYRTLNTVAPTAAPSSVQERLRNGFHANVRRSMLLAHELLDLIQLFEDHDIPVVPFKGPVAAAFVYDDLHVRPFGDLDLLVHLPDVPRAERLLLNHQFEDWETLPPLHKLDFDRPPSWHSALTRPFGKAKNYVRDSKQGDKIPIELHWELVPPYFRHPLDPESFWKRVRTITLLDTPVRTFSLEDTLFHFCLHGTVHRWSHLRLVCDVAELLRRHSALSWEQLLNQARRLRSERLFLLALRLAHELLEAPLPPPIQHRVYDHGVVESLAKRRIKHLVGHPESPSQVWSTPAYAFQIRDRLRDGIGSWISHARIGLLSVFSELGR